MTARMDPTDNADIGVAAAEVDDEERRRLRGALAVLLLVLLLIFFAWWWFSRTARVPDVVGLADEKARAMVVAAGFVVGDVTTVTAGIEKDGTIADQEPSGGVRRLKGSEIDLDLAAAPGVGGEDYSESEMDFGTNPLDFVYGEQGMEGADYPQSVVSPGPHVPSVLDQTESQARSTLSAAGYKLGSISYGPSTTGISSGRVFFQDPAPDSYEPKGTVVDVWISNGTPGGYPYPEPPKP